MFVSIGDFFLKRLRPPLRESSPAVLQYRPGEEVRDPLCSTSATIVFGRLARSYRCRTVSFHHSFLACMLVQRAGQFPRPSARPPCMPSFNVHLKVRAVRRPASIRHMSPGDVTVRCRCLRDYLSPCRITPFCFRVCRHDAIGKSTSPVLSTACSEPRQLGQRPCHAKMLEVKDKAAWFRPQGHRPYASGAVVSSLHIANCRLIDLLDT